MGYCATRLGVFPPNFERIGNDHLPDGYKYVMEPLAQGDEAGFEQLMDENRALCHTGNHYYRNKTARVPTGVDGDKN